MIMRWIWLAPAPDWYIRGPRGGGRRVAEAERERRHVDAPAVERVRELAEALALAADQVRRRHGCRVEVERRGRRAVDAVLAVGRAGAEARRGAADDEGRHAARAP